MGEVTAAAITLALVFDTAIVCLLARIVRVSKKCYLHWQIFLLVFSYELLREILILVDFAYPIGFMAETAEIEAFLYVLLTRVGIIGAVLWALRQLELQREARRALRDLLKVRRADT